MEGRMADVRPRKIDFDCKYFQGDRPCIWHKQEGLLCTCKHFDRIQEQILIIKLDAMGDVLRTTALLPPLAKEHPTASIAWITRPESRPLLERNPYISEIISYGPDALIQLQVRDFDRIINLDAGKISSSLASMARSSRKDGYVLDARGFVLPTNTAARRWLEMGIFDDLKKGGTRTYQDIMSEILGLESRKHQYVLNLSEEERAAGRDHLKQLCINFDKPIIGLNTGGGARWPFKQWRAEGYSALMDRISSITPVQFVLLGGPAERERNKRLLTTTSAPVFDSGSDNPVRHFAAILSCCDLVVTGDTLAMHIALALGIRTVVLFGPTSSTEIDLYGLGEKIMPDMKCLSCYKTSCDFVPNCMDLISVDMVEKAVLRQLNY
jgi:heptosyltransferase-2